MKIYVISDIHGSLKYLNDFMNIYNEDKGDLLVILGDVLYHGPRNPLPLGYDPQGVMEVLNKIKDNILWIKGNCDGEVDEMVLDFNYVERAILFVNNRKVYLTHGHKYNIEMDIPGYDKKDISIECEDGVITLEFDGISQPEIGILHKYTMIINGIQVSDSDVIKILGEDEDEDKGAYITMYLTNEIYNFDPALAYNNDDAESIVSLFLKLSCT